MDRVDPINFARPDTCDSCDSTDDVVTVTVQEYNGPSTRLLCAACAKDQLTKCPDCDAVIWQADAVRVFSAPALYCLSCAHKYPHMIEGYIRELRADEQRDDQSFIRR